MPNQPGPIIHTIPDLSALEKIDSAELAKCISMTESWVRNRPAATARIQFRMLSSVDMSASNGIAPNSMRGGIATAKAIRHRYQTGQLKAKDGSWYARFYDEVPDGNGGLKSRETWKKLGRIEDYPRERDIFPVFDWFMQAVNDRLMGSTGPDARLRVFIEQSYLPSLRLEKKTIRGYNDTWNLHWKSRIGDLTFSQLHPDIAFRMLNLRRLPSRMTSARQACSE